MRLTLAVVVAFGFVALLFTGVTIAAAFAHCWTEYLFALGGVVLLTLHGARRVLSLTVPRTP